MDPTRMFISSQSHLLIQPRASTNSLHTALALTRPCTEPLVLNMDRLASSLEMTFKTPRHINFPNLCLTPASVVLCLVD
eukprot:m.197483 g.197483  ORF g.197483 m.197483 type:complete len:79 (-) comp10645_c1_seq1:97-333(-)